MDTQKDRQTRPKILPRFTHFVLWLGGVETEIFRNADFQNFNVIFVFSFELTKSKYPRPPHHDKGKFCGPFRLNIDHYTICIYSFEDSEQQQRTTRQINVGKDECNGLNGDVTYDDIIEAKRKYLDPDVHSRYGSTDTLAESIASSTCTSVSQLEKSQENYLVTKRIDSALVNDIEFNQPRYVPGKNTPVYKRKFGPDKSMSDGKCHDKHVVYDANDYVLYNDSVMESMVKSSNKYVNRLKNDQDKRTQLKAFESLGRSMENTGNNSLQYSLRDMERLDKRGDWKFNCSYSQAMEQENIELQTESKRKSATKEDFELATATSNSKVQLEYSKLEKIVAKEIQQGRKEISEINVAKPPRSKKPSKPYDQQARVKRQRSYMNAVGRDESYRQDMEDLHEDSSFDQSRSTVMELSDQEEESFEKFLTVSERIRNLESQETRTSDNQFKLGTNENASDHLLTADFGDRPARWSLNASYQKAMGVDDGNSTQEDQCFEETETPGAALDPAGSMTSEEDRMTLQSETDSNSARITSDEVKIDFEEDDDTSSEFQHDQHGTNTKNECPNQSRVQETEINHSDCFTDSKCIDKVAGVNFSSEPARKADDTPLSEVSEEERTKEPPDGNMVISERDDTTFVVQRNRYNKTEDVSHVPNMERNKRTKYGQNVAQESKQEKEIQAEPYVVEFTAKTNSSASDLSNNEDARAKFKQFLSNLHLAETSTTEDNLNANDGFPDSPRRKKPVPSPRKKSKVNNYNVLQEQVVIESDNKREEVTRINGGRELSPYDNVPADTKHHEGDKPGQVKETVEGGGKTESLPQKQTKVNPILAQFLRKFTNVPNSPLNRSLPGPQENNSLVLVEDDYVPEMSHQSPNTSSFLLGQDGSLASQNIMLEGSLSFLKNTREDESTLVGSDETLSCKAKEHTEASLNDNGKKVFSSPTKYSFLDLQTHEESECSSEVRNFCFGNKWGAQCFGLEKVYLDVNVF